MTAIQEIEARLPSLTAKERADLATRLLSSLPSIIEDEDEGVAEALRREADATANPGSVLTLDQFASGIAALRRR